MMLRRTSLEYNAPVGLLGLMITIARVCGVILARMSSILGDQSVCSSQR